jgi:excinuclease ABC subunit A
VLGRLVDGGNTVLVIEHNLDVIKTADWIIDMGPEGGAAGGEIIATGTPEQVARVARSYTGQHVKPLLERTRSSSRKASSGAGSGGARPHVGSPRLTSSETSDARAKLHAS